MLPEGSPPHAPRDPSRLDDAQLVGLVRAGREEAFAEVHARYRPSLLRLARRLLHNSGHDPEDVLQDAFLSAYTALRVVDRPIALGPWLSMIVRNRAIDYLRQPHAARVAPDSEHALMLVPARAGDPGEVACAREEVREVVDAIGRLPHRQRLALVARELEGRPVEDVAAGLGTTIPAAWSLLFRAHSTMEAGRHEPNHGRRAAGAGRRRG